MPWQIPMLCRSFHSQIEKDGMIVQQVVTRPPTAIITQRTLQPLKKLKQRNRHSMVLKK